ncbi:hypothetical protein GOP47_0022664 [Adiantum capillus-veneris]|uniref:Uncharacterized protein n=1 Tax=Adiantum capillus-veneris TaxID=13818 RepID=A0A9D4Z5Q7_ADICA|nr:hypothetical protein GOP47_0022664 [Adiantum capillus-veneris]
MRGNIRSLRRLFPPACKAPTIRADLDIDPSAAVSRRLSLGYRLTALRDTHHEARPNAASGFDVGPWEILQDMTTVANVKQRIDQAEMPEKVCPCGAGVCKVWTATTARNAGRKFYKCPSKKEEGHCGFFEWCDVSSSTSLTALREDGDSDTSSKILCPCGAGACVKLTAKTEKNMGRQFYRCPLSLCKGKGCSFFKWCDEMPSPSNATIIKECHKCGMDDHWAKDCFLDDQIFEHATPAGQRGLVVGSCHECGLVGHWAKDCPSQQTSHGRKVASSPGCCFTCGNPGHWARDCPTSAPSTSGGGFSSKRAGACSCCF